ncbi:P-loop containing nucleoside triphosphate hydrolase protein [Aspergillus lucknowensis]|uniref:P-loop containing nucleoside triphosphate hydrolase protein n=1 Tax=Aspergillus lucknowensis TaxID=176173 RepID=A0ABR4M849_9EURO
MSTFLFSKGGSTVKFPVKSIRYHGLEEDISAAQQIAIDPAIHVLLSSAFIKIRQGASTDGGRSRSFWNVTFHIAQITVVSLKIEQSQLVYTFKSNFDLKGEPDTQNPDGLQRPSEYALATVDFLNKVVEMTLGLPSAKLWEKQSELVCQALRGHRFTISDRESEYIAVNREAINKEAEEEHKSLAVRGCRVKAVTVGERILLGIWPKEERPFRLYRGCSLILRKNHRIRGEKGAREDWTASVTEDAPKFIALLDAPVYAVLMNEVDVKLVDQVDEDDVQVHVVANPITQTQMLEATRKLSEHWGEENFDAMCREFETQETILPSGKKHKLPLTSMFLASTPRVNTHDPLVPLTNLETLVPANWRLNDAQIRATTQLLTHSFSLVVGPPGTGKTRTIAAAPMFITQILRCESVGEAKLAILVLTHDGGSQLMRLRSRADSEARLFAELTSPHDDVEQIIARANEQPGKFRHFLNGIQSIRTSGRVKSQFREFNRQRRELIESTMENVRVVVALPLNVKEMLRREFNPEFVIFDDASFFRDPEIFHVLGQLRADARVLFVGDHRQLSPPVFTKPGEIAWSTLAFERLVKKNYHQTQLNVSYRSHSILYHATSVAYYEAQVQSFHDKPSRNTGINRVNPLVAQLGDQTWTLRGLSHFVHLAHVKADTQKDASGSLFHAGARDILIMSPYRAQVGLVQRVWEQMNSNREVRPRVQTVDASQGSEAEVVIVLITRNFGSAGFLTSSKRTNVMLSRACTAQYVVGALGCGPRREFGRFCTYLDEADHVLGKTDYVISPAR